MTCFSLCGLEILNFLISNLRGLGFSNKLRYKGKGYRLHFLRPPVSGVCSAMECWIGVA